MRLLKQLFARARFHRSLIAIGVMSVLAGCLAIPDGVEPVTGFDVNRYSGTWYEVARLDHRFERGLSNVTASYSVQDDGTVKVVNRGYNLDDQSWDDAVGKAAFVGAADVGYLKVSFLGLSMVPTRYSSWTSKTTNTPLSPVIPPPISGCCHGHPRLVMICVSSLSTRSQHWASTPPV